MTIPTDSQLFGSVPRGTVNIEEIDKTAGEPTACLSATVIYSPAASRSL